MSAVVRDERWSTHLLVPECIVLPAHQLFLDAVNLGSEFTSEFLVHCGRLLGICGQERLCDDLLDVPFDERCQVRGEDASKVVRNVGPKEKLLDFNRKYLKRVSDMSATSPNANATNLLNVIRNTSSNLLIQSSLDLILRDVL